MFKHQLFCFNRRMNSTGLLMSFGLLAIVAAVVLAEAPRPSLQIQENAGKSRFYSRTITRQTRGAGGGGGGKHNPLQKCCNMDPPAGSEEYMNKKKETFAACKEENDSGEQGKEGFKKIMQCVMKKEKMIDDSGNLNEAGIKAAFNEMPLHDHQKKVKDAAISSCVAKSKSGGGPMGFFKCLGAAFANACPSDKQDTSDKCNDFRAGKMGKKRGPSGESE